jgi:D-alanyl-D-alanine carboxypeptidase
MSVHITEPVEVLRAGRRWRLALGASALAVLTGVTVAVAPPASTETSPNAVQQGLNSLVRDEDFPAAMASVREAGGRSRFYSAGVGDLETGAPVPVEGQVRMASATKMFTATVVLQLVGEGKIGLDEPIETYLPGLVRGEGIDGHDITVRQLLQHTSGLPEYFTVDYMEIQHRYVEPRELLDRALAEPATFEPGTSWQYSNTNYIVAGLIVQRVTGRPVGEEITNRIIKRVGLKNTYWPGIGEQTIRGKHAHGYYTPSEPGQERVDFTEMDPSWGWAAGQMIGSPGDINKFLSALVGGKLLKPAQLREMQETVAAPGFPPNWQYGLGLVRIELSCGEVAWGHGGDIDGYETRDGITADGRAATVVVTALPTREQAPKMLPDAVLDTALCD